MITSLRLLVLAAICFCLVPSGRAESISVVFEGANTGVNDGFYYVMPYQIQANGTTIDAVCFDIFDDVSVGQTWTANVLTVAQAAAFGQFSNTSDPLASYKAVGFLSQQQTHSDQDQVNLQHDIWNVFAANTYTVTSGMQAYLDLINTPAFTNFDFNSVRFLEDADQSSTTRGQAFVVSSLVATPEPGTMMLLGAGCLLITIGKLRKAGVSSRT